MIEEINDLHSAPEPELIEYQGILPAIVDEQIKYTD